MVVLVVSFLHDRDLLNATNPCSVKGQETTDNHNRFYEEMSPVSEPFVLRRSPHRPIPHPSSCRPQIITVQSTMEALPAQPSPHVAHEVPPAEQTKSELTTFWLIMGVVTFAALIAACVKWTPSKVWRTTRNLPGTLRERFNAPRDNRPVVSVATELENFSSEDRRGGSSDQSNRPTHTAASNDNSTSPGPETTEELVESSASSPAPTLVGSDETEHTIRAVPVESLPHSPSPVYRPNRLPRDRNRFRPWLFNIL